MLFASGQAGSVTTSDNNVLSTVVDSGLRYLLSIVIGLLVIPTSEYECSKTIDCLAEKIVVQVN